MSNLSSKQLETIKETLKEMTNLRTSTPDYYSRREDRDWTYYCSVSGFVGTDPNVQIYVSFTLSKLRGRTPVLQLDHTTDNAEMVLALAEYITKGKNVITLIR
jgi:hypothetical protein